MANPHNSILYKATIGEINGANFQIGPSAADAALDAARDRLEKHIAPNALPDSDAMYDGPKCYPQTRKAIHRKLGRWIRQQDDMDTVTRFIWLQGGAGAGKSAIMRTTALGGPSKQDDTDSDLGMDADADAERNLDSDLDPDSDDSDRPCVLGSFFFSRQDLTRNTARSLIPTLALQLCDAHPAAKDIILKTISAKRELIFTTSLLNQVRALLIRPLAHLEREYRWLSQTDKVRGGRHPGRVFVIDGLDECAEPKKQSEVIEALAVLVKELPVRVLLASRPDMPIPSAIRHCSFLRGIFSEISLSDDPDSDSDIRLFLEESLREVRRRYISKGYGSLPDPWPTRADMQELVWKSSGHFIYASTVERYISSGVERPDVALRVILGLQVPRTGQPFEQLNALYRLILENARFRKEVLEILSFNLFEEDNNPDTGENLLSSENLTCAVK